VVGSPQAGKISAETFAASACSGTGRSKVTAGDGPEIQVKVYGLFSDVRVTDQTG
jgi:hypothetical protein